LAKIFCRLKVLALFETRRMVRHPITVRSREPGENPGRLRHCYGIQTSNATGSARGTGKAGERFEARSQDTNLVVLVRLMSLKFKVQSLKLADNFKPQTLKPQTSVSHFSDKEKDEASPLKLFLRGFVECLHSPFCRSLKVFCFRRWNSSFSLSPSRRNRLKP
jgi:hypothetical protein